LQRSPSRHGVPFGAGGFWQPRLGLQESSVQGSPSTQLAAVPALHTPAIQISAPLQTSLSEHDEPSGIGGPGLQVPALQASPVVQRLPSSHGVPLGAVEELHVPSVHTSVVQGSPSSQSVVPPQAARNGSTESAVNSSVESHASGGATI